MPIEITITISIGIMLFEIPIKNLVINGSSAPAFINWPTTWGNTNANSEIITTIENPIKIKGYVRADITFYLIDALSSK